MTSTTATTWYRLARTSWEDAYDVDPNRELDLTDKQREAINDEAKALLTVAVDAILAPYGCDILGNGEIIRRDIADDSEELPEPYDTEGEDLLEELRDAVSTVCEKVLDRHTEGGAL